ncbi:SGNH/GDSL hydrolase family protein [Flavivirga eckloniae]|uniref:Electron transporter RnfD n=1 Tax=Flavivirga eckloniae TaxID=1803846 RepID=A0A2K9PTV9_9FLAO|nr:electron transporter RnfD [Flavivirga eckloniae]AUP80495.1 electron transporter RnfD [Flavivirga eckloniae]
MKNIVAYSIILFLLVSCKTSHLISVSHTDKRITYEGRIGQNEGNTASEIYWSGSSIKINFEGTTAKATLEDENGENYFNIIIDGTEFETLKLSAGKHTYTLAENLPFGKHSVELTKRNEWTYGTTRFYGFDIMGSQILPADKEKPIFIEFYGDSITTGHGNEDYSGEDKPEGNVTNNYNTYAAMTARNINAEYACIARGGIGIMVSWFNMIMPEMYYRLNPNDANSKWDFSKKQADIMVVNLFQNDSWIVNHPEHEEFKRRFKNEKPNEEQIVQAYSTFIKILRDKNPTANMVCVLGNMDITKKSSPWMNYVQKAVSNLNDKKIHTCFVPYKNSEGHPKVEEHITISKKLTQLIKSIK